ncbi:hypothetical protein BN14_03719 [Rhizoctonia solani AG-1 IB]|uniref:Glucose-methanol-choline oxidoreductase C-terminal domain-containing protein n=1 Tax=Thanatephorus cucumeris (strain AG1-IB / isolate 7/3/14) TaxID=1108050 RepID=M5BRA0_THACB|nr:hypothetical protein BN14_03719 [Rhizoctonia solani AG-1 IB]
MGSLQNDNVTIETDIFIAGSGPVGCTFARVILDSTNDLDTRVFMVDIGSLDSSVIGEHQKNDLRYQRDGNFFGHVIDAALQPVSITDNDVPFSPYYNPKQDPSKNLPSCAITRTVGGMGTHWTCACPEPEEEECQNSPIKNELPEWLGRAKDLLKVRDDQYNNEIRHILVKLWLEKSREFEGRVRNLPLAVERSKEQQEVVTFAGPNTILGDWAGPGNFCTNSDCEKHCRFSLRSDHRVSTIVRYQKDYPDESKRGQVSYVAVWDLRSGKILSVKAKKYVIALGAICTPQVLWDSGFSDGSDFFGGPDLPAIGRYLSEQSLVTCQVVLKEDLREKIKENLWHNSEPQVNVKFTREKPWNGMINHDAYLYGSHKPGFKYDQRFIVDLRFYGRSEVSRENRLIFKEEGPDVLNNTPGVTFDVTRSDNDKYWDSLMEEDMRAAAKELGEIIEGSEPIWQPFGAALHVTGTTRMGHDNETKTSVVNEFSKVHGQSDLYVGGNGVIPDATACNPTLTSVGYAIKAAEHIVKQLRQGDGGSDAN